MSTISGHDLLPDRPPRQQIVEYLLGASLVALLVTPLALPPVLAADTAIRTAAALLQVLGATFVGYLAGLLVLLRRADNPH